MSKFNSIIESQNQFMVNLYMDIAKNGGGNLFFSPSSIFVAFAMVHMGSKDNTEKEIKSVMNLPDDKSVLAKSINQLMTKLDETKGHELNIANMMFQSSSFNILQEYHDVLTSEFKASSQLVDFSKPEITAELINAAVEKATNSKIKKLLSPNDLDEMTQLVLVNAIYFKGFWMHKFDPKRTENKPFWVTPDSSVKVPMMMAKKSFHFGMNEEFDCQVLRMDYEGQNMGMFILLPNKHDGLKVIEEKLPTLNVEEMDKSLRKMEIAVTMPKFKLEESLDLIQILERMGIRELFSPRDANLSGITGHRDLHVSKALHKAFLEVNEEGSEAAAATAVVMAMRAMPMPPRPFEVNKPFFFFIRDGHSKSILFVGRCTNPSKFDSIKDEF